MYTIASLHRARRDDLHHWLCTAHPLRLDLQTRSDIYIKSNAHLYSSSPIHNIYTEC